MENLLAPSRSSSRCVHTIIVVTRVRVVVVVVLVITVRASMHGLVVVGRGLCVVVRAVPVVVIILQRHQWVGGCRCRLQLFSIVRGKPKIKTWLVGIAAKDPRSSPRQIL